MSPASALTAIQLNSMQLIGAGGLVALAILISRFLKLDLEKDFFIAALRTVVQLIAVGFVLRFLLQADSIGVNLAILSAMTLIAAQAITARLSHKSLKVFLCAFVTLLVGVWPAGLMALVFFFKASSLQKSYLFVPFMGVLLGNALTAVSLVFVGSERIRRENLHEIETARALGASPTEACRRLYRDLMHQALTPVLNGMTIVGVVSLPGMMAGQLLGGVDPLSAARFQILVMFLILLTSVGGTLAAVCISHILFMPTWLHKRFDSWLLRLAPGERLALSGESGIGKTRLLKSLAGVDDDSIRKSLADETSPRPLEKCERRVIYLHQKPFFVPGTVEENLRWPLRFRENVHSEYEIQFVKQACAALNLAPDILARPSQHLSGGEAQLVHLLRALLLKPETLLLDEPTSSLDSSRECRTERFLLNWLEQDSDRRILFVSHDPEQIRRFSTDSLYLRDGKICNE
ncbi:MAG: ABC transporter permease [Bdellovibrionales bacterium]